MHAARGGGWRGPRGHGPLLALAAAGLATCGDEVAPGPPAAGAPSVASPRPDARAPAAPDDVDTLRARIEAVRVEFEEAKRHAADLGLSEEQLEDRMRRRARELLDDPDERVRRQARIWLDAHPE